MRRLLAPSTRRHVGAMPPLVTMVCALGVASEARGQSTADNLAKYARLRARLSEQFVYEGQGPGRSIPAHVRLPADGMIRWADGTVRLGWYIGLLASEHFMLAHPTWYPGFAEASTADVERELHDALLAFERLDRIADAAFPEPCSQTEAVNGFFVRDDVPAEVYQAFPPATQARSDFIDMASQPTINEMSQDQGHHLLLGLALVVGLVPSGFVVDGRDLAAWAAEAGERIGRHMANGGEWMLVNPACGDREVARGADARALSRGVRKVMQFITGGTYVPDGHLLLGALWEEASNPDSYDLLKTDNLHMAMALASAGHGWNDGTSSALVELAGIHGWWIYPLIHRAIFEVPAYCADEAAVVAAARALLDELPTDGIPASPYPNGPAPHGFTCSNRFIRSSDEHYVGKAEGEEYNGLDYLLLHNVLAIASPTSWEGGGVAVDCGGAPIPASDGGPVASDGGPPEGGDPHGGVGDAVPGGDVDGGADVDGGFFPDGSKNPARPRGQPQSCASAMPLFGTPVMVLGLLRSRRRTRQTR